MKWKMYKEAIVEQEAEDKKNTSFRQKKTEAAPPINPDEEEGESGQEEEYDYESFGEEDDPEYEARKSSNYKKIKDRDAIRSKT